jgi:hypothetical protein
LTTFLPLFRRFAIDSQRFSVETYSFKGMTCSNDNDLELDGESSESGGVNGYSSSDSDVHAVAPARPSVKRVRKSKDSLEMMPV